MAQKAWGFNGVRFQNGAKKEKRMQHAVKFENGANLELTSAQPLSRFLLLGTGQRRPNNSKRRRLLRRRNRYNDDDNDTNYNNNRNYIKILESDWLSAALICRSCTVAHVTRL